jgi:hypothetical protein
MLAMNEKKKSGWKRLWLVALLLTSSYTIGWLPFEGKTDAVNRLTSFYEPVLRELQNPVCVGYANKQLRQRLPELAYGEPCYYVQRESFSDGKDRISAIDIESEIAATGKRVWGGQVQIFGGFTLLIFGAIYVVGMLLGWVIQGFKRD